MIKINNNIASDDELVIQKISDLKIDIRISMANSNYSDPRIQQALSELYAEADQLTDEQLNKLIRK